MFKTSKQWEKWWSKRQIDWFESYFNIEHPHRKLIMEKIKQAGPIESVFEIGCAAGANLALAHRLFQVKVGGVDINKDAIDTVQKMFPYHRDRFEVRSGEDLFLSDRSISIMLTDMTLIYLGPFKIGKILEEIKRVTRERIILVEFHHESVIARMALRLATGYYAYNYRNLLERYGFYDIEIQKLTEQHWPGGEPQRKFGYIITARTPM